MINTIAYGLTIGAILYIISIGLSLTFGTMRIVNFAHGFVYTIGAYLLISSLPFVRNNFFLGAVIAVAAVIPISYVVERFVIRKLYGVSIDYAIIATYAVVLIGVDLTKWIWGASPIPLSDPIGRDITHIFSDSSHVSGAHHCSCPRYLWRTHGVFQEDHNWQDRYGFTGRQGCCKEPWYQRG